MNYTKTKKQKTKRITLIDRQKATYTNKQDPQKSLQKRLADYEKFYEKTFGPKRVMQINEEPEKLNEYNNKNEILKAGIEERCINPIINLSDCNFEWEKNDPPRFLLDLKGKIELNDEDFCKEQQIGLRQTSKIDYPKRLKALQIEEEEKEKEVNEEDEYLYNEFEHSHSDANYKENQENEVEENKSEKIKDKADEKIEKANNVHKDLSEKKSEKDSEKSSEEKYKFDHKNSEIFERDSQKSSLKIEKKSDLDD